MYTEKSNAQKQQIFQLLNPRALVFQLASNGYAQINHDDRRRG